MLEWSVLADLGFPGDLMSGILGAAGPSVLTARDAKMTFLRGTAWNDPWWV